MYEAFKGKRYWTKGDVKMTWKEMKEGIVGAVRKVCGVVNERIGCEKQTKWRNDETKSAVKQKKGMYGRSVIGLRHRRRRITMR